MDSFSIVPNAVSLFFAAAVWLDLTCPCEAQQSPRPARPPEVSGASENPVQQSDPLENVSADQIKKLIAGLADLDRPDFGLSSSISADRSFAPLAGMATIEGGQMTDHGVGQADNLRRLVQLGPKAMPFLLEALDDQRPTKLVVQHGQLFLNPEKYVVKIGDVCYVAIGQITGRHYSAVHYVPSGGAAVESPAGNAKLAKQIRGEWGGDDPAKRLYEKLEADYHTKLVFNGRNLNGWDSRRVTEAAMRLLYYFPRESTRLLADRLDALKVPYSGSGLDDAWMKREVANGVRADELIKAVSWCQDPLIKTALVGIYRRTDDPGLLIVVLPSVEESEANSIPARLVSVLDKLPESAGYANRGGYELLETLIKRVGKDARPALERYLRESSLQRSWTVFLVLGNTKSEWGKDLVIPMLTDKREGRFAYGPMRYSKVPNSLKLDRVTRLCDQAASTLSKLDPEIKFDLAGDREDLDRQIAVIEEQLGRLKKRKGRTIPWVWQAMGAWLGFVVDCWQL
jgi:hypothetical protein